jgi:hypothetical protein
VYSWFIELRFYGGRSHKSKRTRLFYLSLQIQKRQAELYTLYFVDCKTVFPGKYYLKFPCIWSECELGAYSNFLFFSKHCVHCCLKYPNETLLMSHCNLTFTPKNSINKHLLKNIFWQLQGINVEPSTPYSTFLLL